MLSCYAKVQDVPLTSLASTPLDRESKDYLHFCMKFVLVGAPLIWLVLKAEERHGEDNDLA